MTPTLSFLADDDEDESYAYCPVCGNPWGDIRHVPEWSSLHGRPVLTCNWDALHPVGEVET